MVGAFRNNAPARPEDIPGYNDIHPLDPDYHNKKIALLQDAVEQIILSEPSEIEPEPRNPWLGRIWFGFWSLGSLALSIAVAIGCAAKFTNTTNLASVNMSSFVNDFTGLGDLNMPLNGTSFGNLSTVKYFGLEYLPDAYHFGIAGICRQKNDTTNCSQHFSPSISLLSAITADTNNTEVLTHWTTFLNSTEYPSWLSSQADVSYPTMGYASSILLLVSIGLGLSAMLNTLISPSAMALEGLFLLLLDALILAAAATLWTLNLFHENAKGNAWQVGMSRPSSFARKSLGPGFGMFWAAVGAKLLGKPLLLVIFLGAAFCIIPPVGLGLAIIFFFRGGREGLSERWQVVKRAFRLRPST